MAEEPRKKVDFFLVKRAPKPIYNVVFKTLEWYNCTYKILQHPMAIYCFPSYQPHLAQPEGYTEFEIKFKLPECIAKTIRDNPTSALLQFRFGEELPGMSELSEGLPGQVLITINSHEKTTRSSPVEYNCSDYLYLEKVDIDDKKENIIKICWPTCNKPFYMVVNIVDLKTVEDLVTYVQCHNRVNDMTLNTKAKAVEMLKTLKKTTEVVYASMKLSFLCPITNLKMKLPARSLKCHHLTSFDLYTFFSLNKVKSTWKCPTCNEPIQIYELVVDSFLLDIMNSSSLPENCLQIVLYANGNWEPHMEIKKEIIEDDQSETDNEYSENMTNTVDLGTLKINDGNLRNKKNMQPKTNDSKHDDIKPKIINHNTDNSDLEGEPSTKITKLT